MARSIRSGKERGGWGAALAMAAALAATLEAPPARAEPGAGGGKYGLGVFVGDPIGITAWFDVGGPNSVDLKLSYDLDDYLYASGDYRWSSPRLFGGKSEPFTKDLSGYVGAGVGFLAKSDSRSASSSAGLAIRVPLGLEWRNPVSPPIGAFVEFAPGFLVVPETDLNVTAVLGARFYF